MVLLDEARGLAVTDDCGQALDSITVFPKRRSDDNWTARPRTLSDFGPQAHVEIRHSPPAIWPFTSRYFNPYVMSAVEALELNQRDTVYLLSKDTLTYVEFTSHGPFEHDASLDEIGLLVLQEPSVLLPVGGSRVLFIPQWRMYNLQSSIVHVALDPTTWTKFLDAFLIPPNVVELLHDNNGGSWEHTSHCSDMTGSHKAREGDSDVCAYHLCLKLCERDFLYARYDFHSKSNFILVMGTRMEDEISRLRSQFRGLQSVHLFHILLAILDTWSQGLERVRWSLDFSVMMLESNTGHGPHFGNVEPLPPQDLSLMRKIVAGDQACLGYFLRHSGYMGELYDVLSRGVNRFEALQGAAKNPRIEPTLQDTISQHQSRQKAQENQARSLCERLERQWSVSVALMANHDTGVTIQMAKDARTDNLLMRKIGVVSIIFLPATFLATFFSMMFFQVDSGGRLRMNSNIWMYFASTSTISLIIISYFRCGNQWKMALSAITRLFGKTRKSMKEKLDNAV